MAFSFQRAQDRATTPARNAAVAMLTALIIAFGLMPCFGRGPARPGWRKLHAGTPCLGESNGNRLFCGARAMFSFADMMEFLTNEFSSPG